MRRAARNLSSNYLAYAASILSGLVLTPVIIGAIGKEAYGAWAFVISVTILLRLLDVGITPTVVRFTAFHGGGSEPERVNALASTALAVYALVGIVSVLVGLVLAWLLPDLIALSPELRRPAQAATVIAVVMMGTQPPLGLFGSLLKGAQRFDVLNLSALISIVMYSLLVVAVFTRTASLPVLASITLASTVTRLLLPTLYVRRELPDLRLSRRLVGLRDVRELLSFSRYAFTGHLAGKVLYSADVLLIGAIAGARAVAVYAVASRLFGLAAGMASTGTDLLLPFQSELEGRADHARQRLFLATGLRAAMCVAVLLSLPLVLLPDWVIGAWLGPDFGASVAPLALLGAAVWFVQPNVIVSQFLFARGRPRGLAAAQASLSALNLGLTATLLLTVREVWVAALATLVVEGVGAVAVMPALARRRGIPYRLLAGAWSSPLLAGAIAALPTLLLARVLFETRSLLPLAAVGAAWALVFCLVAWRLALSEPDRVLVRRLFALRRGSTESEAEAEPVP